MSLFPERLELDGYVVRQAFPEDADALYKARIEVAKYCDTVLSTPDEISLESIRTWVEDWLKKDRRLFLVVEYEGEIVGQLWVWFYDSKDKLKHVAEIGLEIVPRHQGKGLGKKLFKIGVDWAEKNGAVRIQAETLERNIAVIKIMEECGFKLEGKKYAFVRNGDKYENAVSYYKIVGNILEKE